MSDHPYKATDVEAALVGTKGSAEDIAAAAAKVVGDHEVNSDIHAAAEYRSAMAVGVHATRDPGGAGPRRLTAPAAHGFPFRTAIRRPAANRAAALGPDPPPPISPARCASLYSTFASWVSFLSVVSSSFRVSSSSPATSFCPICWAIVRAVP